MNTETAPAPVDMLAVYTEAHQIWSRNPKEIPATIPNPDFIRMGELLELIKENSDITKNDSLEGKSVSELHNKLTLIRRIKDYYVFKEDYDQGTFYRSIEYKLRDEINRRMNS